VCTSRGVNEIAARSGGLCKLGSSWQTKQYNASFCNKDFVDIFLKARLTIESQLKHFSSMKHRDVT